jgi:hypothetical protein
LGKKGQFKVWNKLTDCVTKRGLRAASSGAGVLLRDPIVKSEVTHSKIEEAKDE